MRDAIASCVRGRRRTERNNTEIDLGDASKYGMNNETDLRSRCLQAIRILSKKTRQTFQSIAAVQISDQWRIPQAACFAEGSDMVGATRIHRNVRDDSFWWEFELLEDAVLFRLKFDGYCRPPMSGERWSEIANWTDPRKA